MTDDNATTTCVKIGLIHPPDIHPEDLVNFLETRTFRKEWKNEKLTNEDKDALSLLIMIAPKEPPIVPGTGGVRKMRFVPPRKNVGKSHGLRVWYAYFEEFSIVVLMHVYSKNRQEDLSHAERNDLSRLTAEIEQDLMNNCLRDN